MAAVQHTSVITIHDRGRTPDDEVYIVMELVDGASLNDVIEARASATRPEIKLSGEDLNDPQAMAQLADAQGQLNAGLGRLLAVAEAYPDLKANQNMMQLSEELTSTENKVAFARQAFNDAVMSYNTKVESFPDNVVAGMFQFKAAELLQASESAEERKAPKVSFS